MSVHQVRTGPGPADTFLRVTALTVGAVFLAVGLLGFVPGAVQDHGSLEMAGHHSEALLFGVFQVSVLHNVLHLLFGVAGIAVSPRARWAVGYLVVGGIAYLGLWVYGLATHGSESANFVPLNTADNWLHLGLGVGMLALGVIGYRWWRGGIGGDAPM